jgi:hydroxypyruvate reductase
LAECSGGYGEAENVMLIALGTDGDDVATDAAGAVVTAESPAGLNRLGWAQQITYPEMARIPFFEALGDLLKTGPTGTNVNDLTFLCACDDCIDKDYIRHIIV